jgi:hypothetical protein
MKPEVKDRLVTGLSQYLNARSAGSSRFAVSDSYLAMDNYFSAILIESGIEPTKNHKHKLELVLSNYSTLFDKAGITKDSLQLFYDFWQKVRYSSTIPSPNETLNFLNLAYHIISIITEEMAKRDGKSANELEEELYIEVLGSRWSSFDEECSYIHEMWQQELEMKGEMGYGSKLGNKMVNPSNFSDIAVFSDDSVTKKIISEDTEVGSAIAKFYQYFLKLVVLIQNTRFKHDLDLNDIPNFMLSLRLRYHGQSMEEITNDLSKIISQVIESINKRESQNNKEE